MDKIEGLEKYTTEYCPWCDTEQEILSIGISACPNCSKPIVPCSICIDCNYSTCPYGCDGINDEYLQITN